MNLKNRIIAVIGLGYVGLPQGAGEEKQIGSRLPQYK
jgi:UDP-N-acetyl-D-mannosaminuronate dehydrogenase